MIGNFTNIVHISLIQTLKLIAFHEQYMGVNGKIFWWLLKKRTFWLGVGWVIRVSGGFPGNEVAQSVCELAFCLQENGFPRRPSSNSGHTRGWQNVSVRFKITSMLQCIVQIQQHVRMVFFFLFLFFLFFVFFLACKNVVSEAGIKGRDK